MKTLWIAVALFVIVEVKCHQSWGNYYGNGYGRGNNPGRGPPWVNPSQQNNAEIEWVCRNQKTDDTMIIVAETTQQQQQPGRGPWWQWQNVPPGHQSGHHNGHQNGQQNYPIFVIQEQPTNTHVNSDGDQTLSPSIPETYPNHQPQTYPNYPNQPQTYPNQPQTYPNQPQTYPNQPQTYPSQPQTYPNQPQTYPTQPQTTIKYGGEGSIDIRLGNR